MKDSPYFPQARLVARLIPLVAEEKCFALKGGTAINLFHRDMPRLSVDIDLTYLPLQAREESLAEIGDALRRISGRIRKTLSQAQATSSPSGGATAGMKLLVNDRGARIKIEPNQLLRGSVYPPEIRRISLRAQEAFELFAAINTLSFADLYGGKICAALDRQHPRDLFDLKLLFENEAQDRFPDDIRQAFVIYVASHSRPMHELLSPNLKEIEKDFLNSFRGMTSSPVSFDELLAARSELLKRLPSELTESERRFLFSVKDGEPAWSLMNLPGIERLPGIEWKLVNIRKMPPKLHAASRERLKNVLGL